MFYIKLTKKSKTETNQYLASTKTNRIASKKKKQQTETKSKHSYKAPMCHLQGISREHLFATATAASKYLPNSALKKKKKRMQQQ